MTTVEQPAPSPAPAARGSLWHRLYHGETNFDFVGKRRIGFIASGILILLSVVSLIFNGLNLGIDFEGGVAWEFEANGQTVDDARAVLDDNGVDASAAKIQTLSGPSGERLRIQVDDQPDDVQAAVKADFAEAAGVPAEEVSVSVVSPTWGEQITRKALRALIVFFLLITIYISIRFEWKMAVASLIAVLHDVLISVGIYSIFGFEVTPATVIAFLTILGFSLYDTIVVFDKVHENTRKLVTTRASYGDIVNLSMNQVLMRSINTSLAAVLPVISLLVVGVWLMGAIALQDFALALLVGLLAGSYSSIFIATPVLAVLKGRESRYRPSVRKRPAPAATTPAAARSAASTSTALGGTAAIEAEDVVAPAGRSTAGPSPALKPATLTHAPRPRKKRRR